MANIARKSRTRSISYLRAFLLIGLSIFALHCSGFERPTSDAFYAQTAPPKQQEFRWSNGKAPKSLDPARAAAAPEADIVRAVYEGLTDLDAISLKEIPGIAEKWESSPDLKTWTFHLRRDARWSNGEPVTAHDFVRSWKRLADMREKAANSYLFRNIVGMGIAAPAGPINGEPIDFIGNGTAEPESPLQQMAANSNATVDPPQTPANTAPRPDVPAGKTAAAAPKFGVEAVDDLTLRVSLESPDRDLPRLVANPIFRPVYGNGRTLEKAAPDKATVTNGAFRIVDIGDDGIMLERSENYWNNKAVGLERVRFVPMDTAEKALEAYRAGKIDAITNANFEPLALKLLTPYEDFRRTTHSAVNLYEFNLKNAPFTDRRVREALAIAIDRDRLIEAELEGSVEPANNFLPLIENMDASLPFDVEHARANLESAGYPNGQGFPVIRLLINRNNTQQRIARSVARMWKQNLNLETQIIVKAGPELDAARAAGEYDLFRRGLVLPSADESVSLAAIFDLPGRTAEIEAGAVLTESERAEREAAAGQPTSAKRPAGESSPAETEASTGDQQPPEATFTELDAIFEVRAIPLYFPKSYSLLKPYVRGFEMNGLDAPSLKEVSIDSTWQPKAVLSE